MKIKALAAKFALWFKKNNATIAVVSGTTLMAAGAVTVGVYTYKKLDKNTSDKKEVIMDIRKVRMNVSKEEYTTRDYITDLSRGYRDLSFGYAKTYCIPAALLLSGAALIFKGHSMMLARNAALASAYAASQTAFQNYRNRVIDKYGAEVDEELRNGTEYGTISDTDEKGNIVTSTVKSSYGGANQFEIWCDPETLGGDYDKNINLMMAHLHAAFDVARMDMERSAGNNQKGYIFLNKILKYIGVNESLMPKEGQLIGYLYDYDKKELPYIDIDVKVTHKKDKDGFVDLSNEYVLVTFNNMSYILDDAYSMSISKKDYDLKVEEA